MTTTAAPCPAPPADLDRRPLPLLALDLPLYRIHRTIHHPLFYSRPSTTPRPSRFDAAQDEFGVLYAAPAFDTCMAETLIRNRYEGGALPLQLDEWELQARSMSTIVHAEPRALVLADLTQPLYPLGGNAAILSVADYRMPNRWSSAIHRHPRGVDGIYFLSRYASRPSVALYDRVKMATAGPPVPLLHHPELGPFLDRHAIGLHP